MQTSLWVLYTMYLMQNVTRELVKYERFDYKCKFQKCFISIRRPVYSNQKPAYGKENLQISISCAGDEETLTDCDFSYNPYCPNYQQIECGSKLSLSKIYLQKRHSSIVPLFHKGNVSITF